MIWRFIPYKKYEPYVKTALNQVAIDAVKKTKQPIVWLAGWNKNCINVGYRQKISKVINLDEAKKQGLAVVRRQGGGGAMYLSKDGEITWGIVASAHYFPKNPNKVYEIVCGKIVETLQDLGISAKHKPINDVVTEKGKISGATIKTDQYTTYIGGTLLYDVDKNQLLKLLRPEKDTIKGGIPEKNRKISSVSHESKASFNEVIAVLKRNLLKGLDHKEEPWRVHELTKAEELAKKYQNKKWLYHNENIPD